jgi:hypothetical protein
MGKRFVFALILSIILISSISFASAGFFSDAWNKITGKAVTNDTNQPNQTTICSVHQIETKLCSYLEVGYAVKRITGCELEVSYSTENYGTYYRFDLPMLSQWTLNNGITIKNPSPCDSSTLDLVFIQGGGDQSCVPDGKIDDTLGKTNCCSGFAVEGSTLCENNLDWFTTWKSCTQICGTGPKCPYGPTGTPWCPCPSGTSNNGIYGIGVCKASNNTTQTIILSTTGCVKSPSYTGDLCGPNGYRLVRSLNYSLSCYTLDQCLSALVTTDKTCIKSPVYQGDLCNGYRTFDVSRSCYTYQECLDEINQTNSKTCTDSDGGLAYYTKGIATQGTKNSTDFCMSDGNLSEANCGLISGVTGAFNGGLGASAYTCPNGCSNGACVLKENQLVLQQLEEKTFYYQGTNYNIKRIVQCQIVVSHDDYLGQFDLFPLSIRDLANGVSIINRDGSCDSIQLLLEFNSESTSKVTPVEKPIEISGENTLCVGCKLDNTCYPFGYRKSGEYCSINLSFVSQSAESTLCENSFECGSNVCISGECISQSLIQKFFLWFKNLFG